MAFLEVENLKKRFGDTEVLRGVDLSLERGEVLAIIGASGGGKTTLLRCLNFLERADEGEIIVNGNTVYHAVEGDRPEVTPEAQLSFGLVFQQFNLFPQYTVLDNLVLACKLREQRKKKTLFQRIHSKLFGKKDADEAEIEVESAEQIKERAFKLLSTIGLSEKANAYPCQLSGGQQQRVAIARALMLSPEILCFDEPTSALDPELTGEVLKVIRSLKDSDRTMIIVTHEMGFARSVADKVIFVADGVIEEEGTPEEVLVNPRSDKVRSFLSVLDNKE
jgi:polar amino acid transport system ATP-binding protein